MSSFLNAMREAGTRDEILEALGETLAERDSLRTDLFALRAENARLNHFLDGSRSLPIDRDSLGRFVREAWVMWALTQRDPKPSWLVPYDELSEPDKEADRKIGEAVARWTLIYDSARADLIHKPETETTTTGQPT